MRIAIFGTRGMLGSVLTSKAIMQEHFVSVMPYQNWEQYAWHTKFDLAVNCAGVIPIKQYSEEATIEANSILPISAAKFFQRQGIPFIHVSTDCVFRGDRQASYSYRSYETPDAIDLYGRSKALGELAANFGAMVLRTSFIGYDHGLLNWFLRQEGEIEGWESAYWTGSTVYEVAHQLLEIKFKPGIYHLSSPKILSKCSVLEELRDLFQIPVSICTVNRPAINRALYPDYELRPIDSLEVQKELLEHRE